MSLINCDHTQKKQVMCQDNINSISNYTDIGLIGFFSVHTMFSSLQVT